MKHKRIIVTHYGGPDAIRVIEEDVPEPKDGEVRVRVLAAGVSLPDIMAREGIHPETPKVPFTPGWDLVGVVDRLGAGATEIKPGQIGEHNAPCSCLDSFKNGNELAPCLFFQLSLSVSSHPYIPFTKLLALNSAVKK